MCYYIPEPNICQVILEKNIFSFTEALNEERINRFSQFCFETPVFGSALFVVNSQEGARTKYVSQVIANCEGLKLKNVEVKTHGSIFVSAFLRIFLLGDFRTITEKSVGIIHLPVPFDKHVCLQGITRDHLEQIRTEAAQFIADRTKLSLGEVFALNERKLNAEDLIGYGIAHKIIPDIQALVS